MNGFFLVDKTKGMTSHDVVWQIKHKFNLDKVGHTGTLDPFASGLLIVCVGKATKLSDLLTTSDKAYTGTIVFGKHYDTYDVTGQVLNESNVLPLKSDVIQAMNAFIGGYEQEPPMHSAIKMDGQKLYHLARQGRTVERALRSVMISRFDLLNYHDFKMDFEVDVSKGTYIRSLAVDLAKKLKTYGALSELRRTRIGKYKVTDAKLIKDIKMSDLITLETYFKGYPEIVLNEYMIHLVKNGIVLDERQTRMTTPFIVKDEQGQFVAYYEPVENNQYKPVLIR